MRECMTFERMKPVGSVRRLRLLAALTLFMTMGGTAAQDTAAQAQAAPQMPAETKTDSRNLAPGFTSLPKGSRVVLMPLDMELFSVSGGGVLEPKADWTEAATRHFKTALLAKKRALALETVELNERDADEFEEINALHGAVARAVAFHHMGGVLRLPTKEDKLDWSLGEAVKPIKEKTAANYALFTWVRDSYASAERKATMVALALLGVGIPGGIQIGYASLVELDSGRILWFNRLGRMSGDLREAEPAAETLNALLENFPVSR